MAFAFWLGWFSCQSSWLPQRNQTTGFLNQTVIENGQTKTISKHLSEYWTDRGIEFIQRCRQTEPQKPFFSFLAFNGPYSLSGAMREKVPSPW